MSALGSVYWVFGKILSMLMSRKQNVRESCDARIVTITNIALTIYVNYFWLFLT